MKTFFHERVFTPFAALVLVAFCMAGTAAFCLYQPELEQTNEELYLAAVLDSMTVEDDEIMPLVVITPESDMVTWRDGKVLMLTINRRPERYKAGETLTLPSPVWTFTDREILAWFAAHKAGVTDWPLRLKQLIGVPPEGVYSHVTAMWVSPDDLCRPANVSDITNPGMLKSLPKETSTEYKTWFEGNIIWSYYNSAYPWTRLGYTYDWAKNGEEYGLSEFLIRQGAQVEVISTNTVVDFIDTLKQQTP